MANWISSKLKAAENILQQIDQQAAESLRKNESLYTDEPNIDTGVKTGGVVPLKDQLKKKISPQKNEYRGKAHSVHSFSVLSDRDKDITGALKSSPKPKPTLKDGDWTELLGTANQSTTSAMNSSNGVAAVRSLSKNGRRLMNFELEFIGV
ncbi:golgin candidate 2-like [Quillaja saponaria]|uniref:Golgin candidate 2-like n=1 Tax=Quillaja saponaria TaxID=32244 RepID=A0AAD7VH31_QUISA|nr:golgin candidate 2-like [Quillaja saponaria]